MKDAHDVLFHTSPGVWLRLVYESSYGGEQTVEGYVQDAHMAEYTTLVTEPDDAPDYVVWNGAGVRGRETGDVVKRNADGRRKVGTFASAEVLDA